MRWVWIMLVGLLAACETTAAPTPTLMPLETSRRLELLGTTLNSEPAAAPTLAVDAEGRPVVAWIEDSQVAVKRWNGREWEALGGTLHRSATSSATSVAVAAGERIAVAWRECCTPDGNLYVSEWDGTSWQPLGDALDIYRGDVDAPLPDLIYTGNGPIVAWREVEMVHHHLFVAQWDGTTWQLLEGVLNHDAAQPVQELALDTLFTEEPLLIWAEGLDSNARTYVARFDGTAWQGIASPQGVREDRLQRIGLDVAFVSIYLALDTTQGPLLQSLDVADRRWNTINFPIPVTAENAGCIHAPALAAENEKRLVLLWGDSCKPGLFISTWDGTQWTMPQNLSDTAILTFDTYTLVAAPDQTSSYIAWVEESDGQSRLKVGVYR